MSDGFAEFDRNPVTFYLFLAAAVMFLVSLTINLLLGESLLATMNGLAGALFILNALLARKPYIRLTDQALSVNIAPIRPFTDIPWSSIQHAVRRSEKLVEISTLDGKKVNLYVNTLSPAQRPVLITALEQRLGSLTVSP